VPREASKIGADWHVDLLGKQGVPGIETGNEYFIIFIDRRSRYRLGFGLKGNTVESILFAASRWYQKAVLKAKAMGPANLNDAKLDFKRVRFKDSEDTPIRPIWDKRVYSRRLPTLAGHYPYRPIQRTAIKSYSY
jgi:hypothetical protein